MHKTQNTHKSEREQYTSLQEGKVHIYRIYTTWGSTTSLVKTQECPSFRLSKPSTDKHQHFLLSLLSAPQTSTNTISLAQKSCMLQSNMLFKHVKGLSVHKVLVVAVSLMRTEQYAADYFLQCKVFSLAEWRGDMLPCNRSWQPQVVNLEERNVELEPCSWSIFTQLVHWTSRPCKGNTLLSGAAFSFISPSTPTCLQVCALR